MSHDDYMKRKVRSAGYTAAEEDKPERAAALASGLEWLLRSEQPTGALLQHHGVPIHYRGGRYFSFTPTGAENRACVVLNVSRPRRNLETMELLNPLGKYETAGVRAELEKLGATVVRQCAANGTEDGTGCEHVTFVLADNPSPSLHAAVGLYRKGCPHHPASSVFCECGWWQQGDRLLVPPAETSVFA